MELSDSNIKKILIFRKTKPPKKIPYISGNGKPKRLLIFRKMELCNSKTKKFLTFSQKKAFLTFPEMEPFTFQPKL